MKKIYTFFWIITVLFSAFMLFSAVPEVFETKEEISFMTHLGYPDYISPFLGIAKILGIMAILTPGYPRIKEWAYAGLAFDLIGATYSGISAGGFQPQVLFMILPIGFLTASYFLYHEIKKQVIVT